MKSALAGRRLFRPQNNLMLTRLVSQFVNNCVDLPDELCGTGHGALLKTSRLQRHTVRH